jgi:hypothetical protein
MNKKVLGFIITLVVLVSACGGPQYPFDTGYQDSADLDQEFAEGRIEAELYDKYKEKQWDEYGEEASRELEEIKKWRESDARADEEFGYTSGPSSGCPNGCTTHKSDCDIKGNISFETGEKITTFQGKNTTVLQR